jgi:hypothetical protein
MVCCVCPCDFWITDLLALAMLSRATQIITPTLSYVMTSFGKTFEQLCESCGGAIEGICPTGIFKEMI